MIIWWWWVEQEAKEEKSILEKIISSLATQLRSNIEKIADDKEKLGKPGVEEEVEQETVKAAAAGENTDDDDDDGSGAEGIETTTIAAGDGQTTDLSEEDITVNEDLDEADKTVSGEADKLDGDEAEGIMMKTFNIVVKIISFSKGQLYCALYISFFSLRLKHWNVFQLSRKKCIRNCKIERGWHKK